MLFWKAIPNSLEEIPLVMVRLYAPPIIREHVEDAQNDNKEGCRPLGLETNGYHTTSDQADKRYQHT
jgi:hypothetical protein